MIYFIGYRESSHQIVVQEHLTKEEYELHQKELSEAKNLEAMKNVYNLFKRNGQEFLTYSSEIEKHLSNDTDEVYTEANRLLINYLSSLQMFIDYGEKHNKKHFGKTKLKEFQEKTHKFYDDHVSYRFMAIMRNYAVHYGFPLTRIIESLERKSGIFASKETLLKFKAWKHVEEDIKKMPELISLDIHVEISMLFIQNLYESYLYDIAPVIFKGVDYLSEMIKTNGGNMPILGTAQNMEEYKKSNFTLQLLSPNFYKETLDILSTHPSIKITVK